MTGVIATAIVCFALFVIVLTVCIFDYFTKKMERTDKHASDMYSVEMRMIGFETAMSQVDMATERIERKLQELISDLNIMNYTKKEND